MNYKIINTQTNESLITDETALNAVIASHCAQMGVLMGALEAAFIRQALESGSWTRQDGAMRIEVTDEAITHHTVVKEDKWLVSQPAIELGDKQTLELMVVVNGVEKTLSISLQDFNDGNGWFVAKLAGVEDVGIECRVPVSKMITPRMDKDDNYIEVSFADFELVIKLEDEGIVLDLLQSEESYVIDSTYAFYSELEAA